VCVSSVDDVAGGWSLEDTLALAQELKKRGVDAIDCSSGGMGGSPTNQSRAPGFQVPFAARVRADAQIPTIADGLIMTPQFAAEIVDNGSADLVAIGREALVNPNWPSAARTHLQPSRGYGDWPPESGWWLDRRADILAAAGRLAELKA
jgi:2,4-dienoyl-CoA reductase-like NADH-dependent reductase (Old Yellow Enzyme family)